MNTARNMSLIFGVLLILGCGIGNSPRESYLDAPEGARTANYPLKPAESYDAALRNWKTAEDISAWIAAHFEYDRARAMQLSETQRAAGNAPQVFSPGEFFDQRTGVCLDLARFGVETLRQIAPEENPQYLMIEFEPVEIAGNTLRLHWIASFERQGEKYFFADSKRPGRIDGPFQDVASFLREYEAVRGRKIIAFRELDSFEKKRRMTSDKQPAASQATPAGR